MQYAHSFIDTSALIKRQREDVILDISFLSAKEKGCKYVRLICLCIFEVVLCISLCSFNCIPFESVSMQYRIMRESAGLDVCAFEQGHLSGNNSEQSRDVIRR